MSNKVKCPICSKEFNQITNSHLKTHNLTPQDIKKMYPNIKLTSDDVINKWKNKQPEKNLLSDFLIKAKIKHGDKYDYSLVEYKNGSSKVKIICPIYGEFLQSPHNHVLYECNKCGNYKIGSKQKDNDEKFIIKANKVHGDKFDYSKVKYTNTYTKVKIICPTHGEFLQRPNNHLNGYGCYLCTETKGENRIREILEKNNIEFVCQKRFKDCRLKRELPFDFYLPKLNILIEYDGKQHFYPIKHWHGDDGLKESQKRDKIKNNFAKNKGIPLLRIPYNKYNKIEDILTNYLSTSIIY